MPASIPAIWAHISSGFGGHPGVELYGRHSVPRSWARLNKVTVDMAPDCGGR